MSNKSDPQLTNAVDCLTCGFCREGCPIYAQFGFAPQLVPLTRAYSQSQVRYPLLASADTSMSNLYLCTLCGYCKEVCPNEVDFPSVVEHARGELKQQGLDPLRAHQVVADRIQRYGNPYEQSEEERAAWLKKLDFKPSEGDTVLFVGCTSTSQLQEIAISTAKILHEAGVQFRVVENEPCCGGALLRTGFPEEAQQQAKKVLEALKGAKEVITPCPLCYRTFTKDYEALVGQVPFRAVHFTEYLSNLIHEGKLNLKEVERKVTYHDPCELGRYCGIYEAPRNILNAIPKLELTETHTSRNTNYCCGAGGGVKAAFPKLAIDMGSKKVEDVIQEKTGIEAIVTACPSCVLNLRDGAKKVKPELKILDISQIVCESMGI